MKVLHSLFFANANPKILACSVHRDCHTRSLKERQMLRELRNPPRQMQKRIWKYPSVFQQPIMGDWLWKKNCWYDLRTQPTVVRQSAHNDGPSQDNTSSILADNLDPNTNNIPMPDYATQAGRWTWKRNVDRLPGLLVSTPVKCLCCFQKLLMGPVEMMAVNSSSSHRQRWMFLRVLSSCVYYTAASIQEAKKKFSPACICWNHYIQCSHKSYKWVLLCH